MKSKRIGRFWFKCFFAVIAAFITISCEPTVISIQSSIKIAKSDGNLFVSVNGEEITCSVESDSIEAGEEIVLKCTNETSYDVIIDVMVNDEKVGLIETFPAEFRYRIDEPGIYQFSINGTINGTTSNKAGTVTTTGRFSSGWSIKVE